MADSQKPREWLQSAIYSELDGHSASSCLPDLPDFGRIFSQNTERPCAKWGAKINRRPDSFESLDARAALPQNCSLVTLRVLRRNGNSPSVPVPPTKVPLPMNFLEFNRFPRPPSAPRKLRRRGFAQQPLRCRGQCQQHAAGLRYPAHHRLKPAPG